MGRMSELDAAIREAGDGGRVERLQRAIMELDAKIAAARDAAYSGSDEQVMPRLEADVLPLTRERRRLRRALDGILGMHARRVFA